MGKSQAYFNTDLLQSDLLSFVRYFKVQREYMIEQEKYGFNGAYESMYLNKEGLLREATKYSEIAGDDEAKAQAREKLIQLIYRYVFFKTYWYADMRNFFYVDISDELLKKIEK